MIFACCLLCFHNCYVALCLVFLFIFLFSFFSLFPPSISLSLFSLPLPSLCLAVSLCRSLFSFSRFSVLSALRSVCHAKIHCLHVLVLIHVFPRPHVASLAMAHLPLQEHVEKTKKMPKDVVSVLKHAFGPQAQLDATSPPLGEPTPQQLQLANLYFELWLQNPRNAWVDKISEGQCRAGGISGQTTCDRTLKHREVIREMLTIDPRLTARRIYVAIKCVLLGRGAEARALTKKYIDHHVSTCHFLENYEVCVCVCVCVCACVCVCVCACDVCVMCVCDVCDVCVRVRVMCV
jgi:hypothetical protein